MSLKTWLFVNSEEYLHKAQEVVEESRYSGLTRHYDVRGVQDSIEMRSGVRVTKNEAIDLINTVRQQNGWGPAEYL